VQIKVISIGNHPELSSLPGIGNAILDSLNSKFTAIDQRKRFPLVQCQGQIFPSFQQHCGCNVNDHVAEQE
jgi:hypothetical protein